MEVPKELHTTGSNSETIIQKEDCFSCIHCGNNMTSLYKRYSATVLKLSECDNCHNVGDKYVEYDIIIIMIDLVLLQKTAYRHVLFNADFKNLWKLSVILLIMESYSVYCRTFQPELTKKTFEETPQLHQIDFHEEGFTFYKICIETIFRIASYILTMYILTFLYERKLSKNNTSLKSIWKAVTVSSFGIFLHLPSLIWDVNKQESHLFIISMYVNLSQLLAYTAICDCSKFWSVAVVFSASYVKAAALDYLSKFFC